MNFSIVLASRERSQLLVALTKSIAENTHDLSQIELLVAIDDDDPESHDAARHIHGWFPWARFFSRPRSEWLNRDYLNWVYEKNGTGKYIIICNDDCLFRTQNWDQIALAKLEDYLKDKPDGIVYGYLEDKLTFKHGYGFCCFPLISRAGFLALGWAIVPVFRGWNADLWLWKTYLAVDRVCNIGEVVIEHMAYHAGKRERDHISYHVQSLCDRDGHVNVPMDEYINALKKGIGNHT